MARYGVETRLKPEEVVKRAIAYFGGGGLGLEMEEREPCCVYFSGGGGEDHSGPRDPGVGLSGSQIHGFSPPLGEGTNFPGVKH